MRCSFTGKDIPKGTGTMYVKKDGTIYYFINHKAEKNMLKLGRESRTTRWTDTAFHLKQESKKTLAKAEKPAVKAKTEG